MGNPFTDLHRANRQHSTIAAERLARSALMPVREKLENWQREAARLHGRCFDLAARHQSCEQLYGEARELAEQATAAMDEARAFHATHRASSRFADLELSYSRLMASIRRLVGDA